MKYILIAFFTIFLVSLSKAQINYTPQTGAGYQFKYLKSDSLFHVPFQDTSIKRGATRPGAIVCRPQDSLFYGWNGLKWEIVNSNSSYLLSLINGKVDSVTVSNDTLKYWKGGVSYGYVLASMVGNLHTVTTNGNTTTNDITINNLYANAGISTTQIASGDYLIRTMTSNGFADSLRGYIQGDSLANTDLHWQLPDSSGTFVLSINGNKPDKYGNVTGLFGGGGSGTDTITNAGFSMSKTILANAITLSFDSSTGFHTQNYNDLRYGSLSQQNANVAAIAQRVLYTDTASMLSPYMRKANNLSDLTNANTALTNLGISTLGKNFITDFSTIATPTYLKRNADNSLAWLDAASFRTDIGAGTGSGTVTAIGVTTANGVSGTSSGGTTPNLTISLGAITPTSTNGVSAATMAYMDATSSVQGQLNGKVNISDTASMLSKYLRKIDTTGKWQPVGSYLTIDSSIYKYDGTLTGDRNIYAVDKNLLFLGDNGTGFGIVPNSGITQVGDIFGSANENIFTIDDINNRATYYNTTNTGKFGINTTPDSAFTLVGGMKVSGGIRFTGLIQNSILDTTTKKIVVKDVTTGTLSTSYWPTGGSGGIDSSIYKYDGTLTGNRALSLGGYTLDIGDIITTPTNIYFNSGDQNVAIDKTNATSMVFNSPDFGIQTNGKFGINKNPDSAFSVLGGAGISGGLNLGGELNLSGITSPATYTSDQTNVAYTGSSIIRVNSNSDSRLITSISGGTDGRIIKIVNVGATDIVLQNDDGSTGTAANRIDNNGTDVIIPSKKNADLLYDATLQRWVVTSNSVDDLTKFRRQPVHEWDYEALGVATANFPTTAIASGTAAYIATEAGHPGVLTTTSSATTNSGHHSYYLGVATLYYFQGGETYECVYQPKVASNTNTTTRFGFLDATTSADAVDGAYFEIPAGSFNVVGKTSNNSTRTTSATIATIAVNTWYRFVIKVNRAASSISFTIYDANGVSQGTQSITTNIPNTSARVFGVGYISTNVGTSATLLGWLDRQAFQLGAGKPLNR